MKKRTGLFTLMTVAVLIAALFLTGCSEKKADVSASAKKTSVATASEKLPRMVDFGLLIVPRVDK